MDVNKSMTLSRVLPQVTIILGSWYGRAANSLEAIRSGMDLRSNFVWVFPIGSEFTMFPCSSFGCHTPENEVTYMSWLQSHCVVV